MKKPTDNFSAETIKELKQTPETRLALNFFEFSKAGERFFNVLGKYELPAEVERALNEFEPLFVLINCEVGIPLFEKANNENLKQIAQKERTKKLIKMWENII